MWIVEKVSRSEEKKFIYLPSAKKTLDKIISLPSAKKTLGKLTSLPSATNGHSPNT